MTTLTRTRQNTMATIIAMVATLCVASTAFAQGGSNCTVSVLNRSVTQNADGSWVLPNVPANFGPVRARVTCLVNGQTISGESDPFVVPANGVVNLPPVHFGQVTPIPTALVITAPTTTLSSIGETTQLLVMASYSNNSTRDVTAATAFTTYTVSNPAIATVSADGVVQAVQSGTVLIQATHEGATGMTSVRVALAGGIDSDGDGIPDADELLLGLNPNNPVDALEDFDRDNLTNLQEYQLGTGLRVADSDGDGLKDGDEVSRRTNPLVRDTDGDGVGDGLEIQTGSDPLDPTNYNLAGALSGLTIGPSAFTLTFNTIAGEAFVPLRVTGHLRDGTSLDLTSTQRGTNYSSSDLGICSFGAVAGRVYAGQSGTCSVTARVGGLSVAATGTVTTFSPTALSSVSLAGPGNGVDVAGDFVYVAVGGGGLQVVSVVNRSSPQVVATLPLLGVANDVKLSASLAFVAAGAAGVHVVDISNPLLPKLLGSVDTPGDAVDVRAVGSMVYVADGPGGLVVVDCSTPTAPRIVGMMSTTPAATGVDVDGALAIVTVGSGGVRVVNVSNPANPIVVGTVGTAGVAYDVVANAGFAYVADYTGSLRAVDYRNAANPVLAGATSTALGGILFDVARMDTFVFGADVFFVNGVPIVDVSDAYNLRPRARLDFPGDTTGFGIAVDGSYVYLATDAARLYIGQYRVQQDFNGVPPTVSIAAPPTGGTFVEGESVSVAVNAVDDLAVAVVALQVNGTTVATDTTAPYQFAVTAPPGGAGPLMIGATATDLGNNVGVAADVVINVIPDPLTTVAGRVVTAAGTSVAGATVTCAGLAGTTLAGGSFSIVGVPTVRPALQCSVRFVAQDGTISGGVSTSVLAVRGGVTDFGDVVIAPVPVVSSISPSVIDATHPPPSLSLTGSNFTGAMFSFAPLLVPPAIAVGTPQIDATGTGAVLPIGVQGSARGRFTLVGTNAFGAGDVTPTPGNRLTLINVVDDADTDGDGFPDGLEVLYGSDPADPTSTPNLSARGSVTAAFSLVNRTLPFTVAKSATTWFSVRNTTLPFTVEKSVAAWFSVRNTTLPFTVEKSAAAWFSVRNTTLPFTVEKSAVHWFSVLNTSMMPTQITAVSSAVSVQNLQTPLPLATPLTASSASAPAATASASALAVNLDGVSAAQHLVAGQTLVIRGSVSNGSPEGRVAFRVNGTPLATDATSPYAFTFTVPAGASALTFGASYVGTDRRSVSASPVTVRVDSDAGTSIQGRVLDANGTPVANAKVELASDGLSAEFFEPRTPLLGLPDVAGLNPTRVTRVTAINMRGPADLVGVDPFGTGLAPNYAARFRGAISVRAGGSYTFTLGARDGARLTVGGRLVVDMPTPAAGTFQESAGSIDLLPGLVPVEITFFENSGSAELQLSVAAPGEETRVVLPAELVPDAAPFVVVTDSDGRFSLPSVPTALEHVRLRITRPSGSAIDVLGPANGPLPSGAVDIGDVVIPGAR